MTEKIPPFSFWVYHIFRGYGIKVFARVAARVARSQNPQDIEDVFPVTGRRAIWWFLKWLLRIGVVPLVALRIPIPIINGYPSLDTTIWIGALAFVGGLGIALITVAPWVSEVVGESVANVITNGQHFGFVRFDISVPEGQTLQEVVREHVQRDKTFQHQQAAKFINTGLFLVFTCALSGMVGIWLPTWWKAGLLAGVIVLLLQALYSLNNVTLSSLLVPRIWDFYRYFEKVHAKHANGCPYCRRVETQNQEVSM